MKKQLLKDLAGLETDGIITPETADDIRNWYQHQEQASPNRLGIILGILGALLAGSGIILIIAHNWDELGKLTKTILAFLPLLATQLLCVYTLFKQKEKKGWREASAVLLFLAIPSSISLVSQIYQVNGELSGFLFTWILLSAPLIYLMHSSVVFLLTIALVTWYAALAGYYDRPSEIPYLYLLICVFITPYYYRLIKEQTRSSFILPANLLISLSVTLVLDAFIPRSGDWYPLVYELYLTLFCIYYFIGVQQPAEEHVTTRRPFYIAGLTGILVILFFWSFDSLWKRNEKVTLSNLFYHSLPYLLIAAFGLLTWLMIKKKVFKEEPAKYTTGFSFAVFVLSLFFINNYSSIGLLIINAWILLIAIFFIRKGSMENHFGVLNFGLFILSVLAICRFFDYSIPFVWRGVFFLITGIAFFLSNYLLISKRKKLTSTIDT